MSEERYKKRVERKHTLENILSIMHKRKLYLLSLLFILGACSDVSLVPSTSVPPAQPMPPVSAPPVEAPKVPVTTVSVSITEDARQVPVAGGINQDGINYNGFYAKAGLINFPNIPNSSVAFIQPYTFFNIVDGTPVFQGEVDIGLKQNCYGFVFRALFPETDYQFEGEKRIWINDPTFLQDGSPIRNSVLNPNPILSITNVADIQNEPEGLFQPGDIAIYYNEYNRIVHTAARGVDNKVQGDVGTFAWATNVSTFYEGRGVEEATKIQVLRPYQPQVVAEAATRLYWESRQ